MLAVSTLAASCGEMLRPLSATVLRSGVPKITFRDDQIHNFAEMRDFWEETIQWSGERTRKKISLREGVESNIILGEMEEEIEDAGDSDHPYASYLTTFEAWWILPDSGTHCIHWTGLDLRSL